MQAENHPFTTIGLVELFWSGLLEPAERAALAYGETTRFKAVSDISACSIVIAHINSNSWEQLLRSASPGTVVVRASSITQDHVLAPVTDGRGVMVCHLVPPLQQLQEEEWGMLISRLLVRDEQFLLCQTPDLSSINPFFTKRAARNAAQLSPLATIIKAYEDKEQRLSRLLHDEISQRLHICGYEVETLKHCAPNLNSDALANLEDNLREIDKVIFNLYYSFSLVRFEIGLKGALASALKTLLDLTKESFSGKTNLFVDKSLSLPVEVETCLYKIARKAIRSSIEDFKCTELTVIARSHDVLLEIQANTRITEPLSTDSNRAALLLMEHFASEAGLDLSYESDPETGIVVRVTSGDVDHKISLAG